MRILVIVDTYPPARISGALQMRDLVREMASQGHNPTVVAPAPDLDSAWSIERTDGVEVLRVRTMRTKDVANVRRALAEWWLPHGLMRGLRKSPLAETRWEGIVWYSPTIFLGPMVRALRHRWGCRAYLILRDLFPDWAVDTGVMRKGMAYRYFKRVERDQYAAANVIGVQSRANEPIVAAIAPHDVKVETLHNWLAKPESKPTQVNIAESALAGRTIFVYAGNMGAAQGMDCLIELADCMKDNRDVGFLFVGRGSDVPRLQAIVHERRLANVLFIGEVDSAEIPGILAQCHVGLIALDPRHRTQNTPGKLLSYLHAGLPVLARVNAGNDLETLLRDHHIGFAVSKEEQRALPQLANELLAGRNLLLEMGKNARSLAMQSFSPAQAVSQVLRGLIPDSGAHPFERSAPMVGST